MKECEKWYENNATSCDPRTANKEGWKAAMERIIKQMNINPNMRNMELEDWIKEELEE